MLNRKHISLILLLAGLAVSATGQMRNPPPASIYSIGGTQLGPPPASIYSLPTGNFGNSRGCCAFTGIRGGNPNGRFVIPQSGRAHGGRHHGNAVAPIYIPYGYPYYGYGDYAEQSADGIEGAGTFNRPESQQVEPEAPAPTVFERRPSQGYRGYRTDDPRYGEHYLDSREESREPKARPAEPPEAQPPAESVATVLVFRDGHRAEIKNYAIMGTTLYLFAGEHRKIPLADLDLEATVRENDDRGIEFQVPANR